MRPWKFAGKKNGPKIHMWGFEKRRVMRKIELLPAVGVQSNSTIKVEGAKVGQVGGRDPKARGVPSPCPQDITVLVYQLYFHPTFQPILLWYCRLLERLCTEGSGNGSLKKDLGPERIMQCS